jgi:hypothetical protein
MSKRWDYYHAQVYTTSRHDGACGAICSAYDVRNSSFYYDNASIFLQSNC